MSILSPTQEVHSIRQIDECSPFDADVLTSVAITTSKINYFSRPIPDSSFTIPAGSRQAPRKSSNSSKSSLSTEARLQRYRSNCMPSGMATIPHADSWPTDVSAGTACRPIMMPDCSQPQRQSFSTSVALEVVGLVS